MPQKNKCLKCQVCYKDEYGGICPNIYCPKMSLNGPCGGYVNGNCEVNCEHACAWVQICFALYQQGKLTKAASLYRQPRLEQG